jgi:Protein of unknown function (DUF642)
MTRMITRTMRAGLVGMVLCSVTPAFCQTNLIKNHSFERPVVTPGTYRLFRTGKTFSHWQVVGDSGYVAVVSETFTCCGFSFPAKTGVQWLDLTGSNSNTATGVAQTVATTPGAAYTLTFYVGNIYDPHDGLGVSSTVNVWVDGQQVYRATNSRGKGKTSMIWQKFTTTIVATSSTTTIAFINGDPSNDNNNGLDAITLVPQGD